MTIDWLDKLRRLLQTLAFCLVVPAIQYALQPGSSYEISVRYSLCIGALSWAAIDFGRHLFPSSHSRGWPVGIGAIALPVLGIALGYVGGTLLGDAWTGLSSWRDAGRAQLRVSIGITVLAGTAAAYYFHSAGKRAWMQAQMHEVHRQGTEAQLRLLQTQLEPHMLFNTLANLRVLIGTDPERAQAMLDRIIAYLRATLSASRRTEHPLQDEFERLHDYLALMAVRMGPRLAYTLDLPEALRTALVPPLLLQPLVENAIRHGLEPQVEGGHITVRAGTRPGASGPMLVIEVDDTGVGLATPTPAPGATPGFGLAQVRERLASLHGALGTLELIANKHEGTRTCVTFPLKLPATP